MRYLIQLFGSLLLLTATGGQSAWSQLIDNGDGTISDVDQQIMWAKDAGMAPSMLYTEAEDWVAQLNANAHLGYSDWRLPHGTDIRSDSTATSDDNQYFYNAQQSEFGYLFYVHLSGQPGCHVLKTGIGCSNANSDPDLLLFDNMPPEGNFNNTIYWTGMASANSPGFNWTFAFGSGLYREQPIGETRRFRGWVVRDAAIPIPQCNDGIDNDGDGLVDLEDSGCTDTADDNETAQCEDAIDNDGDGLIDMEDPNCCSPSDDDELMHFNAGDEETPQCRDSIDNDDDCRIDHPADDMCVAEDDPSESMRCTNMWVLGWVCLSRILWRFVMLAAAIIFVGGAYAAYRRWKGRTDFQKRDNG